MQKLNPQWLTDGLIDFEYKKYLLLSYFKEVKDSFNKVELYPFMADLVFHYHNLLEFRDNKRLLHDQFPASLRKIDIEKLELIYEKLMKDDEVMNELEEIINFALPLFKGSLEEGKTIYEFVEKNTEVSPVGLMPLYADEGYFFISQGKEKEVNLYRYQVSIFENSTEKLRGIHTSFMESVRKSNVETYESLKIALTRKIKDLPNPAVFLVNTKLKFPRTPTLVPVVKRLLVRYLSAA